MLCFQDVSPAKRPIALLLLARRRLLGARLARRLRPLDDLDVIAIDLLVELARHGLVGVDVDDRPRRRRRFHKGHLLLVDLAPLRRALRHELDFVFAVAIVDDDELVELSVERCSQIIVVRG